MTSPLQEARAAWTALAPEIVEQFGLLFAMPELSCLEYRSMDLLAGWMEAHGFSVERGVGDVPTAFLARKDSGGSGPRIGILVEYDALPGLDNEPQARRTSSGRKPGHGCGHNHIGPANAGAGIAAAAALQQAGLAGEIVVVGCPAEEIVWGKLALQAAGVFDGLDAVLTSHGDYQNGSISRPCHATANGEFRFSGESAHSGLGTARNAVAASEAAIAHFRTIAGEAFDELQFKHVYRFAGYSPGVTPDEVRVWASVRHRDFDTMRAGYARMEAVFSEVASAHQVDFRGDLVAACRGYLANDTLGRVMADCLQTVGAPAWTKSDIAFMEELSQACAPGKPFTLHRELAYFDQGIDYYGQDDGDLSWQIPLGRINWAYPENVPIHHWAWTALSGHTASQAGPLMASEAIAIAAVRLIADPHHLTAARAELDRRKAGTIVPPPEFGLLEVLTKRPEEFWDATW
jgi:aminobenzoyl-glutamate utilization protein B